MWILKGTLLGVWLVSLAPSHIRMSRFFANHCRPRNVYSDSFHAPYHLESYSVAVTRSLFCIRPYRGWPWRWLLRGRAYDDSTALELGGDKLC
jgi:hypothetical protein